MRLPDARVCLAAALLLAVAGPSAARGGQQQSPEALDQAQQQQAQQPQPQTPPTTATTAPQRPEQQEPESQRRPSRRTRRTSSRQASSGSQGYLDEARVARDAGPTRKELVLNASLMGGYDDNLTAGLGSGNIGRMAMASGSTASADASLGYFVGNTARSIRMDVAGNVVTYPEYLDGPAAGGSANIGAQTRIGRSVTMRASERVGYEPFFTVFAPPGSGATLPIEGGAGLQATELFERRSLNSNTSAGIDTRWSRRNSTTISYSYGTRRYTDETDYGDSRTHTANARYRLVLANSAALNADYRFQDLEYTYADGSARPIRSHRIEGGPDFQKSLSRGRFFSLSLAAGAGYVESFGPADLRSDNAWVPTGRASATYAFSPTWTIDANYRRDFSMFQSVTDEVYTTDTAHLSTGGLVTGRAFLGFGASYAKWKTPYLSSQDTTMDVYGASAQLRISITRSLAATAGYYYYRHRYSDPGALPAGFPAEFDRNAIRVGLSLWAPLAGTSSQRPLGPR